jgi:signal transduction histidine kinase
MRPLDARPLDRISSIKVKLVVVIVAAVAISAVVSSIGWRTGIAVWMRPLIAVALSLLLVYPFSRGITAPLRQMAGAASAMARGDFSHPVTATSRDEVGELARTFELMRSQLAEVDRQRRALIANVSHELRTPLAVLRVRFENIADGVEPNDADAIAASLAEVERLGELVERVLDLSRLESGASPLHLERVDVAELVDDATGGADRSVEVVRRLDRGLALWGDRTRLAQVVRNLVDNAARHGGGRCVVSARATADGVQLSVSDHGPGIPEAERERVLERFYRVDGARAAGGGSGLGLAIVAEIVELHGGSIEITDHPPSGCRVTVSLPTTQEEAQR